MANEKSSIKYVLAQQLSKPLDEKTSVQIRLYDDKTGKAFYKQLTAGELFTVLSAFKTTEWN